MKTRKIVYFWAETKQLCKNFMKKYLWEQMTRKSIP